MTGSRSLGTTGPPDGWAVGLVSPASFCIQGVVGAFAWGFGLFSSDFEVGTSRIWVVDRFWRKNDSSRSAYL